MPHVVDTLEDIRVPGGVKEPLGRFQQMLRKLYEQLARVMNGGISFGDSAQSLSDNIDGVWLSTTTPAGADTNFTLTHNLGRLPNGWIVAMQNKAGSVYLGSVAATTTQLTLRCSVASVAVRLFIF
jgi:hypothetical protein